MKIGEIDLEFLGHSGFLISTANGKKVAIDPFHVADTIGKVDVILITHDHYDHCSIADITKIAKKGTVVIIPAAAQSKITKVEGVEMQIVEAGDEFSVGAVKMEAVPAYNVNKPFHQKKDAFVGYLVKIGNVVVYHAGDTDFIPEMEKLTGYGKDGMEFVALLPISGKYVMDVNEAVRAAEILKADLVIPMHYGSGVIGTEEEAQTFVERCKEEGIKAQMLGKL